MKIVVYFLALVSLALTSPAEVSVRAKDEVDWSKVTPNNAYVEPVNPADAESVDLPGSRIISGFEVNPPNSQGYVVGLVIDGSGFCGGSIISASSILTAAHCTIAASTVQVRMGAHRVLQDEATQVRVTSTSIVNHAGYSTTQLSNDIAVVLLPSPVSLNNNISAIPLTPATADTFAGISALLVGWGQTSDSAHVISPVLNRINLRILTNEACGNVFGSYVLDSTLCTSGAGSAGPCAGDSGGPLVVDGVQVGVVSFGSARCTAGNPHAYARVSSFRSWITQNAGV